MNSMQLFAGAMAVLIATSILTLLTADSRKIAGGINFAGIAVAGAAMLWIAVQALFRNQQDFGFGSVRVLGLTAQ